MLDINNEENKSGPTGSGGHWLRLVFFALNFIVSSSHLLPVFLTTDEINIIVIMMGDTITVMMLYEGYRKTCKQ